MAKTPSPWTDIPYTPLEDPATFRGEVEHYLLNHGWKYMARPENCPNPVCAHGAYNPKYCWQPQFHAGYGFYKIFDNPEDAWLATSPPSDRSFIDPERGSVLLSGKMDFSNIYMAKGPAHAEMNMEDSVTVGAGDGPIYKYDNLSHLLLQHALLNGFDQKGRGRAILRHVATDEVATLLTYGRARLHFEDPLLPPLFGPVDSKAKKIAKLLV